MSCGVVNVREGGGSSWNIFVVAADVWFTFNSRRDILSVLLTWNATLLVGATFMEWYYTPLYYSGYLLIAVGGFVVIIGEFRKNL